MEHNKNNLEVYKDRLPLLSWLILPIFVLWLSTNYLIGLTKPTNWQNNTANEKVIHAYADNPNVSSLTWDGKALITLWFDDAWYSQYSIGFPVLQKNNLKGALAVPTDLVNGETYMTWPQIARMQYKGWEINSHSKHHECNLSKVDAFKMKDEIEGALDVLSKHNINAQHYVAPCGEVNNAILSEVKKNYLSLRTTDDGVNEIPVKNPYKLKIYAIENKTTVRDVENWIQEAKDQNAWLIIVFHQIGDKNEEYEITPDHFLQVIDTVKSSRLPVVLPSQVLNISI